MDRRTQVLLGLGLAVVVAAAAALVVAIVPGDPTLATTWVAAPPEGAGGNHHGPAVAAVDGRPMVFAPISAPRQGPACGLVALDAQRGETVWRHPVPPADCTVHAVADPTVATWQGGQRVLVATTENALFALDPASGDVHARYDLPSYGYTPPLVVDLAAAEGPELLIVDARGTIQLIGADGAVVWRETLGAYVWTRPQVGDLSGDGGARLALGTSDGRLLVYDRTGERVLEVTDPVDGAITWLTRGQLDDDPAAELVAATARGQVVAVDASTGRVEWTRSFGSFAAVGAVGDADGDGTPEVYATAADGVVRALDGDTGRTAWERTIATGDVQMMPPPALGDVTGDGVEDLVVASNDGRIAVLDPASGTVLADATRNEKVFERATLADVDDDRGLEVVVVYADGAVVRLDYEG